MGKMPLGMGVPSGLPKLFGNGTSVTVIFFMNLKYQQSAFDQTMIYNLGARNFQLVGVWFM